MNIERLRKIIQYSTDNRKDIESKVKKFYSFTGISSAQDVLNILQIVRPAFQRKGFLVLELPFADDEIGALCYRGDGLGYILINTSLPKVNANFAICHEIYHVFFKRSEFKSKVEFANDHYFEHEEEFAANLFAGMLLMPETSFRQMYGLFKKESEGNEQDTIIRLMNYYQVPYMAVLIRCYELELPDSNTLSEKLLNVDRAFVRNRFDELWLDASILNPSKKDDFPQLEALVERCGKEYIQDSYLNERTLEKVMKNMRTLYSEIKGE
ncbi:MAG TPA: ImmA/IrrE family metallo-endopeptidase [Candidatus Scybalocola faecigallinarum]|uniref:ImmA/IrrE family metallo-endopeptidase n=1 Tax=Candidatus Scybalocola faecigallinarum TaxID=2840941 RepID=A0A9D1F405_9FIRM|nr:ImmA/IrrE family metallo-endopeptidase [Candidatus Scybalocola faecigallinarum]